MLCFLNCTLTGDKSWAFQYELETKCQSAECRTKLSEFHLQKPKVQIMLIILSEKQNLIHKESELEGKTAYSEFYVQVLEWLMEQISSVRM
jgi:hypothetical protein